MNIGDKVKLLATGGSIPGIPPGIYFIVNKDINGRIAISATVNGTPLVPSGPIVGQPIFERLADFEYAFPLQEQSWLSLSLNDFLQLRITDYLQLDLL